MRGINDITAMAMMAWFALSPSSPAPAARRYAALGLDRSVRPSKVADGAVNASVSMCGDKNRASQKSLTQSF